MHDAGLNLRLREYGVDRFRKALQSVDDGDQNIVRAAVFDLTHHPQTELRTFRLLDPNPQNILATNPGVARCRGF